MCGFFLRSIQHIVHAAGVSRDVQYLKTEDGCCGFIRSSGFVYCSLIFLISKPGTGM